jgi:transposase InsO family protein
MRGQVIRSCHDDMGHIGMNRTIELIKRVYWFPKMTVCVKNHIENCLKCIVFSPKVGETEGFLKLIEKGTKPFHTIHIDHYGPLNKTVECFRYIFVVVDAFSKFLTLYPVRTVNTKEACSKLIEYFAYYSKPIRIISDRGSCFTSLAFKDFCVIHNIQHVLIAAGSPQANGQVERYNHTLKVMLSKLLHEEDQNWNKHLNKVQFAINNTLL